jgi:hypothetical protein
MPIEFHCQFCGRAIKAPDEAGGKQGKCPNCKNTVYVPTPPDQIEDIPLAPLDENEEKERQKRDREARAYQESLLHERNAPPDGGPTRRPPGGGGAPVRRNAPAVTAANLRDTVIKCVRALADSNLAQSESCMDVLKGSPTATKEIIQGLSVDAMPPGELADIPPKLYQGFLKSIIHQL